LNALSESTALRKATRRGPDKHAGPHGAAVVVGLLGRLGRVGREGGRRLVVLVLLPWRKGVGEGEVEEAACWLMKRAVVESMLSSCVWLGVSRGAQSMSLEAASSPHFLMMPQAQTKALLTRLTLPLL